MTDEAVLRDLIAAARSACENTYSPYSNYPVGSAVLADDGRIFSGCNVENRVYGGTICAERTALVKAVSEGAIRFKAIAVFCKKGNEAWPCGLCRQFIMEFGPKINVVVEDGAGRLICRTIGELLPETPTAAGIS